MPVAPGAVPQQHWGTGSALHQSPGAAGTGLLVLYDGLADERWLRGDEPVTKGAGTGHDERGYWQSERVPCSQLRLGCLESGPPRRNMSNSKLGDCFLNSCNTTR